MSITQLSALELRDHIADGKLTSEAVTQAYLDRIEACDAEVKSYIEVDADDALQQAREVDRRLAAGESVGCLGGLPVAIKDLLCTRGQVTTCASRMLQEYRPPYNATVVEKVKAAGGVLLGKTNLDEFAMGGSTENSAIQLTRNPWDLSRVPGGSSGGAAACVAGGMAPLSIGTDTGGSIRQPAAFCGVVGLKPTYGRVSRFGLVAFASSLDQIGPLAWSVPDAALLLETIAGHDPQDSTSAPKPVPHYSETVSQPLKGVKLGYPREHFEAGLNPEVAEKVQAAMDVYRSLGASITEISLPHSQYAISAYYIIAPSEASSNLARYDGAHYGYRTDEQQLLRQLKEEREALEAAGKYDAVDDLDSPLIRMYRKSRAEGFGSEVKRRIMIGTYALSSGYYDAYYLKALKVRRLIRSDFDQVFENVDFVIGPVTPDVAFPIGAMTDDPLSLYLQDLYTVGANLAGITSISVPCGTTANGLPVGLQLQAPAFEEERLLRAANMFQAETDWHTRRPTLG